MSRERAERSRTQGGLRQAYSIVTQRRGHLGAGAVGLAEDVKDAAAFGVLNRDVAALNGGEFACSMPQGPRSFFIGEDGAAALFFASIDDGPVGRHIPRKTMGLQQCNNVTAVERWRGERQYGTH